MKKISLIFLLMLLMGLPVMEMEDPETDSIETINSASISVNGNTIRVANANGEVLEVFNLTGAKVASIRIDSPDKTLNLNLSKGCYILKVGKVVRKISIR